MRLRVARSRLATVLFMALGLGAAASVGFSDLARPLAWALALGCLAWGTWLASREWRRPVLDLVIAGPVRGGGGVPVHVDGRPGHWRFTAWRGPLCVLTLDVEHDVRRVVLWPDVIDAAQRRELRLRAPREPGAAGAASVAP